VRRVRSCSLPGLKGQGPRESAGSPRVRLPRANGERDVYTDCETDRCAYRHAVRHSKATAVHPRAAIGFKNRPVSVPREDANQFEQKPRILKRLRLGRQSLGDDRQRIILEFTAAQLAAGGSQSPAIQRSLTERHIRHGSTDGRTRRRPLYPVARLSSSISFSPNSARGAQVESAFT
jgi:hypothetical protein